MLVYGFSCHFLSQLGLRHLGLQVPKRVEPDGWQPITKLQSGSSHSWWELGWKSVRRSRVEGAVTVLCMSNVDCDNSRINCALHLMTSRGEVALLICICIDLGCCRELISGMWPALGLCYLSWSHIIVGFAVLVSLYSLMWKDTPWQHSTSTNITNWQTWLRQFIR